MVRRWEFVGGKSKKFWEAGLDGTTATIRYGRIGTNGQTTAKEFDTATKAESYLERVIAEKERKGYSEVAESPDSAITETAAAPEPAAKDEDTFELPGAWRHVLHPRHRGISRPPVKADEDAAREVGHWIRECVESFREILDAPGSDPQLVEEARAHLDGDETPRGAALVGAMVTMRLNIDRSRFADAWVEAHDPVFAARAVAELAELVEWYPDRIRKTLPSLQPRPAGTPLGWRWAWQPAAERLRALLACADERDYREVVDALAGHRRGEAQRLVVSYLAPTETAWVDECCAAPPVGGDATSADRTLLLCALGSADQVAALGPLARFSRGQWSLDIIATTAEGVGTSIAPLLVDALEETVASEGRRLALNVLSRVPTDEAFQIMLDRIDEKYVQPALLEAMRRYPRRALRLLARAAGGSSRHAASARMLLPGHLLAEPELVAAELPGLPADARAVVEKMSAQLVPIESAPVESLPRPLIDPPWTRRRRAAKPAVITGLEPPADPSISWEPGEKERWATTSDDYACRRRHDWDTIVRDYLDDRGPLRWYEETDLFLHGPEQLVRPLLAGWKPSYPWDAETWMRPIVAKYELAALDAAIEVATMSPALPGSVLLPYVDIRVARLMADRLVRLKSARKVALTWLGRHGAEAARLLVPEAVGVAGRPRAAAEAALRVIASAQDDDTVVRAARSYGSEAKQAVEALLAVDPLDTVPARMPKLGDWADSALLPQVLLRDRTRALPPEAVGHLLTMLAISKPGEVYAGLEVVRETCDPVSLAEFGWVVFDRWRATGMPAKDGWALTGLGWIGDDETVRRLTPVIRTWPGEGGHQRAVAGLDVLAAIGTEMALVHLNGIAQRVKFKGLKERAREKIEEVAEGLGLTSEQLADRLVPDFGLDPNGSLLLGYGPRRFVVGFDEQLKPYVEDENGKRRKDLPAPGARDDAEQAPAARKRFADLKKDVRTVAGDQIRRLEAAMVGRRDWSVAEFTDLFVRHPLTWHLARRLVWLSDGTAFRVAEDRTLADVEDDTLTLPDTARITIAHPLDLAGTLDAWAEVFADYEILQPFPQLGRPVYALTGEERAASRLTRFEGVTVSTGKVLGLERHGWAREEPQDAGIQGQIARAAGPGRFIVIGLDPGIAVGAPEIFPEHRLGSIWITDDPDGYGRRDADAPRFADLDPVTASEIIADLTELTS